MRNAPYLNLVLTVALGIMLGWLLIVGKTLLLPIFAAIISLYLLVTSGAALAKLPGLSKLPNLVLRLLVLVAFFVIIIACAIVVVMTGNQIVALLPAYEDNLRNLIIELAGFVGADPQQLWSMIVEGAQNIVDMSTFSVAMFGGFLNWGTTISLVVIYTVFLFGEHTGFAAKLAAAFGDPARSEKVLKALTDMNSQIGDYLVIKSLINVILGVLSYAILLLMGVDFALFWAIVIALLNYVPYVGSLLGVLFPVALSVVQFGSLFETTILLVLLVTAQTWVGNMLEPRMIGRQLNLSPFVIIVSLSFWAAIWGIPGAILAIPMTSIIVIVLSNFEPTRPYAILMSERIPDQADPAAS